MKMSVRKFVEARKLSRERTAKGELNMLGGKEDVEIFVSELRASRMPDYEKTLNCRNKTVSGGCKIPYLKRNKDICTSCSAKW